MATREPTNIKGERLLETRIEQFILYERNVELISNVSERILLKAKSKFDSYNPDKWEKTYFDDASGGFFVTERERIIKPVSGKRKGKEKNDEYDVFRKEQRMCHRFARFGFQIEHLSAQPGISSSDVMLVGHTNGQVRINGNYADLKSVSSAKSMVTYAKWAVNHQHAKYVLFEFTTHDRAIPGNLKDLGRQGIHGFYYYSDENKYARF